jgi:hypothetical protein
MGLSILDGNVEDGINVDFQIWMVVKESSCWGNDTIQSLDMIGKCCNMYFIWETDTKTERERHLRD